MVAGLKILGRVGTPYFAEIPFKMHIQGSHRLEKYLNLEGFLEKSL